MWVNFKKPPTMADMEKISQEVHERGNARSFVAGLLSGGAMVCFFVAGFGAVFSAADIVWKSALFAGIILTALSMGAKS